MSLVQVVGSSENSRDDTVSSAVCVSVSVVVLSSLYDLEVVCECVLMIGVLIDVIGTGRWFIREQS